MLLGFIKRIFGTRFTRHRLFNRGLEDVKTQSLPVRNPWLKGSVTRLFDDQQGIRVFGGEGFKFWGFLCQVARGNITRLRGKNRAVAGLHGKVQEFRAKFLLFARGVFKDHEMGSLNQCRAWNTTFCTWQGRDTQVKFGGAFVKRNASAGVKAHAEGVGQLTIDKARGDGFGSFVFDQIEQPIQRLDRCWRVQYDLSCSVIISAQSKKDRRKCAG